MSDLQDEYNTLSPILDAWAKDKNLNDVSAIDQLLDVCDDHKIMIRTAVKEEVKRRAARKVRSGNGKLSLDYASPDLLLCRSASTIF